MAGIIKLTVGQASSLKRKLAMEAEQCPLCGKSFKDLQPRDIVLDHDHGDGRVRGVLCRGCNGAEGKVANGCGRWAGLGMDYSKIIPWLERLVLYLKRDSLNYVYPTHLTEAEKKAKAAAKRRDTAARKARQSVR